MCWDVATPHRIPGRHRAAFSFGGTMGWRMIEQFQQHKDPRFPNGAGKGVCLAMSIWYLVQARKQKDFWTFFAANAPAIHTEGNRTIGLEEVVAKVENLKGC
jgi:hypothetical protein